MRILLINFEMDTNSPVVPWQARVATALADRATSVHVLTEKIGAYEQRPNMTVDLIPHWPWGLPKRLGGGWLVNWQLFWLLRKYKCDVCFIHMAQVWSYRLWLTLAFYRLPVLLWYAHGTVTNQLRWSLRCSTRVITSTPEGFRIASPKVQVIGQAIDTEMFDVPAQPKRQPEIIYVGRITERKRVLLLLEVLAALRQLDPATPWCLKIAGPTMNAGDIAYKAQVHARCAALNLSEVVQILGPLQQRETAQLYGSGALHLNLSETGSMDKTVMEALACGCPVLTTNIAFRDTLADYPAMFSLTSTPQDLAKQILHIQQQSYTPAALRNLVVGHHDFASWIEKVSAILQSMQRKAS